MAGRYTAYMNYYVKTVAQAVLTFIAAATIAFALFRLMPGGPLEAMRAQLMQEAAQSGRAIDMERINQQVKIYTRINPDQPIYVQYFNYIRDIALHQNFGRSTWYQEPVFAILFEAMPWSVFVSIYGLALGFTTNIILGAIMAYKEGSLFDNAMTFSAVTLNSTPYYVVAIILLATLAYQLGWFPTGGRMNPDTTPGFNFPFIFGILNHATLPILSSFVVGFGGGALQMRGNSISVLGEDYLRVARLRGLSSNRIATRYVARNAILPLYTGLMIGIAGIFSSSVILEFIFTYPGVGWYTFGALQHRDYPLLMGAFIFFTAITITGVFLADMTYGLLDPRIKHGDEHESF